MNPTENVRISESEWEVMRVLWDAKRPLAAAEVMRELQGKADWKPKTVRTFLDRLVQKKAVCAEKQGPSGLGLLHYHPLLDESTTLRAEQKSFLGRFFGGTVQSMLAAYVESGEVSGEELRQLREIIDREMHSRTSGAREEHS